MAEEDGSRNRSGHEMSAETKRCTKCGEVKALDAFGKHSIMKDGISTRCKQCNKNAANAYRYANIEVVREKERNRSASLPLDVKREKHKAWRDKNREAVRVKGRAIMNRLYAKNPQKARAKSLDFHKKNRDLIIARLKSNRDELCDTYIATTLKMHTSECPQDLINLKRQQLQFYRLAKEFKQTVKEVFK